MLTQKELKEVLQYNKDTGEFIWKRHTARGTRGSVAGNKMVIGYITIRIYGKQYYAHRLAWLYEHGNFPKEQLDHINKNKSDNRICNLREVSDAENKTNLPLRKDSTSKITGVSFRKDRKKWRAYITVQKKTLSLGVFENKQDAIKARKLAEKKYNFHPNHERIPKNNS